MIDINGKLNVLVLDIVYFSKKKLWILKQGSDSEEATTDNDNVNNDFHRRAWYSFVMKRLMQFKIDICFKIHSFRYS